MSKILTDKSLRVKLAATSLSYFAFIYLPHYLKNKIPEFHFEIYRDLENADIGFLEIIAFRGSGKSTIVSLVYALWCAIFNKRNFIILCSDTHTQAKQIITNLIYELENNELLIKDFGSFKDPKEDWTATNIFLKNQVRIMSRSRGQKVRGLRNLQYRPDLIVLDDIENIDDVRMKEQRDKSEEWFASDVVPSLDPEVGKLVVIGNWLHNDSLLARLKNKILSDGHKGLFREYPLINDKGYNLWPSQFTAEKIAQIKKNSGLRFFQREFLLKIISSEDALVKQVSYYEDTPRLERLAIGVDLAISQKESADYTSINIAGENADRKIYNLRNIYGKWNFNQTLEKIFDWYSQYSRLYPELPINLGFEDVAYQKAAIEEFYRRYGIMPTPIKTTKDKRARLEILLPYFENDQIVFKREGMEDLINQLLNFGVERYDDALDAAMMSWQLLINADRPQILWL